MKVMGELGIPVSLLEEIEEGYSTDNEKSHAHADYYVYIHPDGSWEHLTGTLYGEKELTAARESKSFLLTGKYC